jgi:hypothetical protein
VVAFTPDIMTRMMKIIIMISPDSQSIEDVEERKHIVCNRKLFMKKGREQSWRESAPKINDSEGTGIQP